jgi:hypothetical protein
MTRRQITVAVVIILVASAISALVAYGCGLKRSRTLSPAPRGASEQETGACVALTDAGSLLGKSGCVKGLVLRVYTSRGRNTFLDFCSDYRTCPFSSVIFASDAGKFGDLSALAGRQVEIRGVVQAYEGRAEIIIRDPQQIRALP